MVDDVAHFVGGEPDVDADQGRADHGYGIVGLQHGGRVRADKGHLVPLADALLLQRIGQAVDPFLKFLIAPAGPAVDHRRLFRVDRRAALQEFDRAQYIVIYAGFVHAAILL